MFPDSEQASGAEDSTAAYQDYQGNTNTAGAVTTHAPYDAIALELRKLRLQADELSYAEIAKRVSKQRQAAGASPAAAAVSRSTIYGLFRTGRSRIDTKLLREVVLALGVSNAEAEQWVARARQARQSQFSNTSAINTNASNTNASNTVPSQHPQRASTQSPLQASTAGIRSAEGDADGAKTNTSRAANAAVKAPTNTTANTTSVAVNANTTPHPTATPNSEFKLPQVKPRPYPWPKTRLFLFLAACVFINLLGLTLTHVFELTVYVDMAGTAAAALLLGPWWGALVGILSCAGATFAGDPLTLYFTPVQVLGALLWGYGAHRFKMTQSLQRFMVLNVIVAISCSLFSAPIILYVFQGHNALAASFAQHSLVAQGFSLGAAVFLANLITSLIDKCFTGLLALLALLIITPRASWLAPHRLNLMAALLPGSLAKKQLAAHPDATAPQTLHSGS